MSANTGIFSVISTRHDYLGNCLVVEQEKKFNNCRINLHLKGQRVKCIAEIDVQQKTLIVKRKKERHYHRASCSYGFNWILINEGVGIPYNQVLLIEKDADTTDFYIIPIEVIKTQGQKLAFVQEGFELQWFLHIKIIMQYKQDDIVYVKGGIDLVMEN